MYLGQIVEQATREGFFSRPLHPYSVALMSAVPTVTGGRQKAANRIKLTGDPPSPINPPKGCRFAGRCPAAQALCTQEAPALREVLPGHRVACHFVVADANGIEAPLDGRAIFGIKEQVA
jgi:peptide/nickel transport system ATP-binding protein